MSVPPPGREPQKSEECATASKSAIHILFSLLLAGGLSTGTACSGFSQSGSTSAADNQISITIAPMSASIASGGALQFSASVSGTAQTGVTWSTSAGTISTGGLLTAPTVSSTTGLTVTATSAADSGKTASASVNVTVADNQISITIAPSSASLTSGGALQFSASVSGTAQTGVTWSTSAGTISTGGLLRAPTVSSATSLTVTATSAADSGKTASASVNVTVQGQGLYNTPTNVSPIAYPTPIPCPSNSDPGCPSGALTGAGWTYVDSGFPNTTLLRATDSNTTGPSAATHRNWGMDCGGSAEVNLFSQQDDRIAMCDDTGGNVFVFWLSWPKVTELYGVCVLQGNPTFCANNFEFSHVTNDWGYSTSLNISGDVSIFSYDVSSTATYPSLINGKQSQVVDLATACSLPSLSGLPTAGGGYAGDLTVSVDDQTFSVTASTATAQDTATYFIVWNRTNGCRVWNTNTGAVTGSWGTTGSVSNADRFLIHNSRIGPDGSWAKLASGSCTSGTCSTAANYLWNISTLTVNVMPETTGGGHTAIGYTNVVNNVYNDGYPPQGYFMRSMVTPSSYDSLPASYPTQCSPADPPPCTGGPYMGFDQHVTWPQGLNTLPDNAPLFSTTYVTYTGGYGGLPDTNAWDGELLAVSTDAPGTPPDGTGNGVVYRLSHLYNSMQEPPSTEFPGTYAIGACSWDGGYCAWTTDWNGMFGNTDGTGTACTITAGNCRIDVVLAQLPTVAGAATTK